MLARRNCDSREGQICPQRRNAAAIDGGVSFRIGRLAEEQKAIGWRVHMRRHSSVWPIHERDVDFRRLGARPSTWKQHPLPVAAGISGMESCSSAVGMNAPVARSTPCVSSTSGSRMIASTASIDASPSR